jgi:hypothetical protein
MGCLELRITLAEQVCLCQRTMATIDILVFLAGRAIELAKDKVGHCFFRFYIQACVNHSLAFRPTSTVCNR